MRPYYSLNGHWGLTQLSTGQPFYVDKRSRDVTPWILLGGSWEIFVDAVLCALARPGDTFIDAGANQGYYTVKIGGLLGPEGRVYAFEANPQMFAFVRENITVNGMDGRGHAINQALGEAPGHLLFHHEADWPGGGTVLLPHEAAPDGATVQTVPVVTLDDALPPDTRIDLMKIDVEGFEVPAMRGMARTLARSPDAAIVAEVSTALWARFGDPAELLQGFAGDRRLFRIHYDGRLEELDRDALAERLDPSFVSYILMLPDTPERAAQIATLSPPQVPECLETPEIAESQETVEVETAPVEAPVAHRPLWRRAIRRLLHR